MAELTTLARPYAKAAFEFALAESQLASWAKALSTVAAVSKDSTVKTLLASPGLTAAQKSAAFSDLCKDELSASQINFLSVLAENNRLPLLPEVSELFELFKANQEKSVDVEIASAFKVSTELETTLTASLKKKLQREVTLTTSVDKSLLGGALIRAGDMVIDGSVRGRLAKLAEVMNG